MAQSSPLMVVDDGVGLGEPSEDGVSVDDALP